MINRIFCLMAAAIAILTPPAATAAGRPMGIDWGVTYGFPPALSEPFMPQARALGASFSRVTLYWSQLEPKQGEPRWTDLDAYLDQLNSPDEGMITLATASPWATRTSAWVFPSSPAKDAQTYRDFVRRVVDHVHGRARYFQADTEPSNRFFWAGDAKEYAVEQRAFYETVKAADPKAVVVLGGFDGLFDPTGAHPLPGQDRNLAFLKEILAGVGAAYDLFDLHLYADPYTIPARVAAVGQAMRDAGADRPIIVSEYNGPGFFEFPANRHWSGALQGPAANAAAVRDLRARADSLPVETQMFLLPDDPKLSALRLRLQAADLVERNLLALASGVQRTAFFDLWHDSHDPDAPNTVLQGNLKLLEHDATGLHVERPLAPAFRRLSQALGEPTAVRRLQDGLPPEIYAFAVERRGSGPLLVVWRRPAGIEDAATAAVVLPWRGRAPKGQTILGDAVAIGRQAGDVRVEVSSLPLLIAAPPSGR